MEKLIQSDFKGPKGPVVLVIMDGIGIGKYEEGDAVRSALTVHLDWLKQNALSSRLEAHGIAVGLPSDEDMGNSEVGHNAIGCGRVFAQGAKLVNQAIESGRIFRNDAWRTVVANVVTAGSTLHFIGLLSDGNVHSHIDHLKAMLSQAKSEGVKKCRIHVLLDGRDVPETSALDYVDALETFLADLNAGGAIDCRISSGGGRMKVTMDRYQANWDIVRLGWDTHVLGKGRLFESARAAIECYRRDNPGVIDQDLPAFVVGANGKPTGTIEDGDGVIFFNFRGDRAIEISKAFDDEQFDEFDRGPGRKVAYAGMMQYDGDLLIPARYLVSPPAIDRTVGEYLSRAHVKQLAISETQKFGHVTYFFNGNRSGKFSDEFEEYVEIPSDIVPFEQRPWMKAAEITDFVVGAIEKGKARFIRLNFPNGDMVGHTGIYQSAQIAVETVDLCLGRIIEAVRKAEGILVVSADHGNADDMYERDKKTGKALLDPITGKPRSKTAHSLNPVPLYVYDPSGCAGLSLSGEKNLGISSLAATCIVLLGFEPPADYTPAAVAISD